MEIKGNEDGFSLPSGFGWVHDLDGKLHIGHWFPSQIQAVCGGAIEPGLSLFVTDIKGLHADCHRWLRRQEDDAREGTTLAL